MSEAVEIECIAIINIPTGKKTSVVLRLGLSSFCPSTQGRPLDPAIAIDVMLRQIRLSGIDLISAVGKRGHPTSCKYWDTGWFVFKQVSGVKGEVDVHTCRGVKMALLAKDVRRRKVCEQILSMKYEDPCHGVCGGGS